MTHKNCCNRNFRRKLMKINNNNSSKTFKIYNKGRNYSNKVNFQKI